MTLRLNSCMLILLLCSGFLCGQENDFINGKVIDQKTGEPVIFASVLLKGKARGVITNMDGGFRLPVRYREEGISLRISSMGYQKKEVLLQQLSVTAINTIRLAPGVLELTEAVVKGKKPKKLSAVQIIRRAIRSIPKNYPMQEFATIGYYRDYQLKKEKYVNLNEAILEVVDRGFGSRDHLSSKVRIYDYFNNKDFQQDFEGRFKYDYKKYKKFIDKAYLYDYGGNEFTILRIHDAVRNYKVNSYDFVNIFKSDLIDNHFFKKEEEIRQEDEVLYTISFRQSFQKYQAYGKLYISKKDYAIHKMEYALYDRYRKLENGEINKQGNNNSIIFEVTTEYHRKYGKMFPNYVSFFNSFEVSKPPEFVVKEVLLDGPKRCFTIEFNDFIDIKSAAKKTNYDIRFEGEKIDIESVKVFDVEVEVYPKLTSQDFTNMVRKMDASQRKRLDLTTFLSAEVTDVYNKNRTVKVNEMKFKTYNQFREFFVQEIKPNGSILNDTLFMKKDIPIFKDQPIVKPDNFDNYWMNTPLKKIIENE